MNSQKVFLLGFVCMFPFILFAQNTFKVFGTLKDNHGETLPAANVAIFEKSGTYLKGIATDSEGTFKIESILPGIYNIQFSYLGFESFTRKIKVIDSDVDLKQVQLKEIKSNKLEVFVEGKIVATQQNNDTSEFNAGAYKVNPDANADDLLKKMPGMDLSSGSPKAQGEAITKVLVDGKPFFGDNPTSSLKNIPAEIIDKVQLYDEKSEQAQFTGFDDGNTSKTVNIVTKPGKKEGIFGKLNAGISKDDLYNVSGNVNYFKNDRRISLIGMSNNVNVQNFDAQDLIGVGGAGGRGRGRRGGGSNFMVNSADGISKTHALGFNYSDKWGEKVDVTASYFFNNSNNISKQEINRIYSLSEQAGQNYKENSETVTENYSHNFNMRLNYEIDSFNSILIIPRVSIQKRNSEATTFGQTFQNDLSLLNQSSNLSSDQNTSQSISSMFLYRHKFRKLGRTFSIWANGGQNTTSGTSYLNADNQYEDNNLNDKIDQQSVVNNNGWNLNSNLNYTEPLTKKSAMQVQYGFRYESGESNKRTNEFNPFSNEYSYPDSLLSNHFTTEYRTHRGGLGYRFSDSFFNVSLGVNYQNAELINQRIFPNEDNQIRSFHNFLPYAMLTYKVNKLKNLRLFYRSSTDAPSVNQLQDVMDNSNPLRLSRGNPNLKEANQHRLRIRYNATKPEKSTTFFASLSGNFTQDFIGNSTQIADENTILNGGYILPKGAQYITLENMKGYMDLSSYATYGMPIGFLKSNLNLNAQLGYVKTPRLINGERSLANNTNAGLGLTLGSNISENVDFTISSSGTYNWVTNTLNTNSNNSFYNQNSSLSLNTIFWKGLVFHTDLTHQFYSGLSEGYNQNFLLWNMSIGKKLFKKQQAEIKLFVFDILGQNNSIQRNISEIYSEDIRTNVLQRYFMLSFTYNLRFFKGNTNMKDAVPRARGDHF